MADPISEIDKSLAVQGADPDQANVGAQAAKDKGNPTPTADNNDPPKDVVLTDEEKVAAAEKLEAEKVAKDATDKEAKDKEEAEAKAKADAEKDVTPLDHEVWGTTGDEVADSVLEMLQNADVTPDEAKALMFDAVQAGDVSKIDVAALEEKVGKTKATLIMAGVTNFVAKKTARNSAIIGEIHAAAGGEENWTTMAAWGKENIPEAELSEYRAMIDTGGAQARFAVGEIAAKYNASDSNTTLPGAKTTPALEGDGGSGKTARSISRAEYVTELTKAHRGNPTEAVLNEITAARHRGRAAGI